MTLSPQMENRITKIDKLQAKGFTVKTKLNGFIPVLIDKDGKAERMKTSQVFPGLRSCLDLLLLCRLEIGIIFGILEYANLYLIHLT